MTKIPPGLGALTRLEEFRLVGDPKLKALQLRRGPLRERVRSEVGFHHSPMRPMIFSVSPAQRVLRRILVAAGAATAVGAACSPSDQNGATIAGTAGGQGAGGGKDGSGGGGAVSSASGAGGAGVSGTAAGSAPLAGMAGSSGAGGAGYAATGGAAGTLSGGAAGAPGDLGGAAGIATAGGASGGQVTLGGAAGEGGAGNAGALGTAGAVATGGAPGNGGTGPQPTCADGETLTMENGSCGCWQCRRTQCAVCGAAGAAGGGGVASTGGAAGASDAGGATGAAGAGTNAGGSGGASECPLDLGFLATCTWSSGPSPGENCSIQVDPSVPAKKVGDACCYGIVIHRGLSKCSPWSCGVCGRPILVAGIPRVATLVRRLGWA